MDFQTKLNSKYIFNPGYTMRNDVSRIVLATRNLKDFESSAANSIVTFIHPVYATLFSMFNGDKTLDENIEEASQYFQITYTEAADIIGKFVDNSSQLTIEYDGNFFYLPQQILIEYKDSYPTPNYSADDFVIETNIDVQTIRLNIPLEANILINNKCATNCIYCYADKRTIYDCSIPIDRIKELIAEAQKIGIISFDVQGGELFLYKNWCELLQILFEAGYTVYTSTKYPLKKVDIDKLIDLGVKEVQISLDSIYEEDLQRNLGVGAKYHTEILDTVSLLNDAEISIKLKAVITNPIFDIEKIDNYINYFKQYPNVKIVEITVPAHSLYKTQEEFFKYRLNENQIEAIIKLVEARKESCRFELSADVPDKEMACSIPIDEKQAAFYKRSRCTGNQSSFIILPNGDVSICEETYFNKNMILGNILENSIMEVWSSDQAKNLFFIPQSRFPKESPCSECAEFDECRYDLGICWTDAMAAYGEENWLYPTPDCPYAPECKNITKTW